MTTLIIARHGNTFEDNEPPRRIGRRTDLPLTEKGRAQARALGRWLQENDMRPDAIFTSHLRRTRETAALAMIEARLALHLQKEGIFNEIDYGPDENKTEAEVMARIGEPALKEWDEKAIVPPGWKADPESLMDNWQLFGERIRKSYPGCVVMVITSNGIARFAPCLTGDWQGFKEKYPLKISTGAFCILESSDKVWAVRHWNKKP